MHKEAPSSSFAVRTGVVPDLEPLKAFLKTIRRTKAAASLRSLGEGGWWTQERMHAAGFEGVEDSICKACNDQVGTLYHRCAGCAATIGLMRSSPKHRGIIEVAQSAVHCEEPLFQHGVPRLQAPLKPPHFVARWCGGVEVQDFQLTGDAFSDGSVLGGRRKGHERAGWATVMIDSQGLVLGGIYGTCPDFFPSSLRAELWGVLQTLRHACPPITIWVDNAGVVEGITKGRRWCCDSRRPAADLWRMIWWKVDDLGAEDEGVLIRKVKGHATAADVEAGRSTVWHKAGNDHADHFAGRGSVLAEELSSTLQDREVFKQAKAWYRWLATLVANWPADTDRRKRKERSSQESPATSTGQTESKAPAVEEDAAKDAAEDAAAKDAAAKDAAEDAAKEARRSASGIVLGRGHRIYISGRLHWCAICGAYAEQRFKSLKEACTGAAGKGPRSGQLARMMKGNHPQSGERMAPPRRLTC
jgi:hypothetical protein